uniref:Beta/gamma crystallin 'Greek key' domain-containing protein n=1 Tax=Scophthalmus maximus TaxID=52904 RepID=A0A8D3ALL4_SCOMX
MGETHELIFYKDKNYQGRRYQCESDCTDFHSYRSRCNSARVEGATWVIYERPGFSGHLHVLTIGEYLNYQSWAGFNDQVSSCKRVHFVSPYKIQLYGKADFGDQVFEATEDCPSVLQKFLWREVHSCRVLGGWWVFYEREYCKPVDWGAVIPTVQSFRRIID